MVAAARFRSATVNCEHCSLFIVPKALFIATKGRSSLQATLALHVRAPLAQNFKLQTPNFKLSMSLLQSLVVSSV